LVGDKISSRLLIECGEYFFCTGAGGNVQQTAYTYKTSLQTNQKHNKSLKNVSNSMYTELIM